MVIKELKNLPKGVKLLKENLKRYDLFLEKIRREELSLQERKKKLLTYLDKELNILAENKEVFLTAINAHMKVTKNYSGYRNYRLGGYEEHPGSTQITAERAYPYAEKVLEKIEYLFEKLYMCFFDEKLILKREIEKIKWKEKSDEIGIKEIEKLKKKFESHDGCRYIEDCQESNMHYEDIKAMQEEVLLEQKELKITKECYALTKNITKLLRKKYEKKTSWKSGFIFHKEFSVTIFEPKFFATWNNEIKPLISKQMVLIQELLKEEYMNEKLDIDLERAL